MAYQTGQNMIVGLDIGTSKVVALIAEVLPGDELQVVGMGTSPTRGLKKGVVVDIESTVQSIQQAVNEAQQLAECHVHSAYVGLAGSHIRSQNSDGSVAIHNGEVSRKDMERVLDAAQAVPIAADQRILHRLGHGYLIDEPGGVRQPLGIAGGRLWARVRVGTCGSHAGENVEKCDSR